MIGHHISSSQLSDHSFNSSLHHLLLQLSADQPQVLRGADLLLVELLLHHVVLVDVDLVPDGLDDDPGVGGMPVALSHHVARVAQEDKARPGGCVCEVVVVVSHTGALVLVIYSIIALRIRSHTRLMGQRLGLGEIQGRRIHFQWLKNFKSISYRSVTPSPPIKI